MLSPTMEAIDKTVQQLLPDKSGQFFAHALFSSVIEAIVLKLFFEQDERAQTGEINEKIYFLTDRMIKMGLFPIRPPKWLPLWGIRDFFRTLDDFYDLNEELYSKVTTSSHIRRCPFHSLSDVISQKPMPRDRIRNQLLSFYFAGFETTVRGANLGGLNRAEAKVLGDGPKDGSAVDEGARSAGDPEAPAEVASDGAGRAENADDPSPDPVSEV